MLVVRSLAVAAVAIQAMLLGGVLGVRSSIRSRFMRVGMLLSSIATFAAAAVVLASLLAVGAHTIPEYVMAVLDGVLSAAELAGVWLLVLYINNQQRRDTLPQEVADLLREHRDAAEHARESYVRAFDDFPALVWRADTAAQRDYFNKAWLGFRGRTTEEERGDGWRQGVHPDDLDGYVDLWLGAFEKREAFDTEYRLSNADGEYRRIEEHGRPFLEADGTFLGYLASCSDVTEMKEQADRLAYLADHDPLTGLANLRALRVALDRALARAQRNVPSILLVIDLDHFKAINERMGHSAGDAALVSVARLLTEGTRAADVVARLGGDEFAVLLEMTEVDGAVVIAQRLVDETRSRLEQTGLSIGLAALAGSDDVTEVLRRADESMNEAKRGGGSRVVVNIRAARHDA
jgi:diguanylate cyclase (GGDEF)-like protein/PAS domain S-box-containing protein